MADREKVIKGIGICLDRFRCSADCPYYEDKLKTGCMEQLQDDAIALLKEQEAVAPIYEEGEDFLNYFTKHTMGRCGHCKAPLPALDGLRSKFCWMCGRPVKWDA